MKISLGPGPSRAGLENHRNWPSRAELKLNRAGRASRILEPFWAGPDHEKLARFEPWGVLSKRELLSRTKVLHNYSPYFRFQTYHLHAQTHAQILTLTIVHVPLMFLLLLFFLVLQCIKIYIIFNNTSFFQFFENFFFMYMYVCHVEILIFEKNLTNR